MAGNIEEMHFLNKIACNMFFSDDNYRIIRRNLIVLFNFKNCQVFVPHLYIYLHLCIVMNIVCLADRNVPCHNIFLRMLESNLTCRNAYANE